MKPIVVFAALVLLIAAASFVPPVEAFAHTVTTLDDGSRIKTMLAVVMSVGGGITIALGLVFGLMSGRPSRVSAMGS